MQKETAPEVRNDMPELRDRPSVVGIKTLIRIELDKSEKRNEEENAFASFWISSATLVSFLFSLFLFVILKLIN